MLQANDIRRGVGGGFFDSLQAWQEMRMARRGTIQSMTPHAAGFGSSTAEAGGFLRFVCGGVRLTATTN